MVTDEDERYMTARAEIPGPQSEARARRNRHDVTLHDTPITLLVRSWCDLPNQNPVREYGYRCPRLERQPPPSPSTPTPGTASPQGPEGPPVVLYFYPKDDTSGCTTEACEFRDAFPRFKKSNAVVLGVSPDSVKRHQKFKAKYELPFTLLADPEHAVCEKYGVWQEKSMYGRKYMGVARTTFIIDGAGKIAKIFTKVKPAGHAAEVEAALKEL